MFVTWRRLLGAAVLVAALGCDSANARAEVPALLGDTTCRWGSVGCNPPAEDPVAQVRALRDHGDVLGFRMGEAPDVSMADHWQGVQRLMPGQGRYLVVSRSGAHVSFVVVAMGSRNRTGARYRSNRLAAHVAFQPPPASDVVRAVAPDPRLGLDRGFDHSGGIQAIGSYLVVGLERSGHSRVAFWDVSKPTRPRRVGTLVHRTGIAGAGTVSIARLRSRRYVLVVGGKDADVLDVYLSRRSTLARPSFKHVTTWHEEELRTELPGRNTFGNFQNLSLISDRGGTLYLLGSHTTGTDGAGPDFTEQFRLEGGGSTVRVTKVAERHLYCAIPFGGRQCNFDAAGGAYVTPAGRLLLYGTEHDNDGPGGSVKLEEFRGLPHATSCRTIARAWVELAEDPGFDGDRSVMIDYRDRAMRDYENYDRVEGFEDKASAGQWCLPPGWLYRLYEDKGNCGGRHVDLVGTGLPQRDTRFGDGRGAVTDFNDAVSCSRWIHPRPAARLSAQAGALPRRQDVGQGLGRVAPELADLRGLNLASCARRSWVSARVSPLVALAQGADLDGIEDWGHADAAFHARPLCDVLVPERRALVRSFQRDASGHSCSAARATARCPTRRSLARTRYPRSG